MMSFPKLHVRNIFELLIPICGNAKFSVALTSSPSFGISLTQLEAPNTAYHYQILICESESFDGEFSIVSSGTAGSLTWGKRHPYMVKFEANNDFEGLLLRLKINHGVFQFRKQKTRIVKFYVNCFSSGQFIQQGVSQICELHPKKRGANESESDDTVTVPVAWLNKENLSTSFSDPSRNYLIDHSSPEEDVIHPYGSHINGVSVMNSSDMDLSDDSSLYQAEQIAPINQKDQYMVLYKGNAEVVGNFRALNFYKASDINLKEDIQLLMEDRDCRDALLKIDGVEYKFKDHVNHATNKRFVGYIAQQIESVIPEAVQLVDGILHVDYESLIPYLSESIKQNFKDISDVKSETERINKVVDAMYAVFIKNERQQKNSGQQDKCKDDSSIMIFKKQKFSWSRLMIGLIVALVSIAGVMAIIFVPRSPNSLSPSNPIITPSPNPQSDPTKDSPLSDNPVIRSALEEFYNSTRGENWKVSPEPPKVRWLTTGVSYCNWEHVQCELNQVVEVRLVDRNLQGTIPSSIGKIISLQRLILTQNNLNGTIPDSISNLRNLQELDLSNNPFAPYHFLNIRYLTNLNNVRLGSTNLVGSLPYWISEMSLFELNLRNNNLTGTIPTLGDVKLIDLSSNSLAGSVPKFVRTNYVSELRLANNRLTGTLDNLQTLTAIFFLDIRGNTLEGDFAAIGTVAHLSTILISNNRFTSMPKESPEKLEKCMANNIPFECPLPKWVTKKCGASCIA